MSEPIYPNTVDKIKDLVTRPPETETDLDGAGNITISPIGFPVQNYSGSDPATTVTPIVKVTYKDPKTYPGFPTFSEEGEVVAVHPYLFDGTENDNKSGHFRNGYSEKELADFMRARLASSLEMGKLGGLLQSWFLGNAPVNLGGVGTKTTFVHPLGINLP